MSELIKPRVNRQAVDSPPSTQAVGRIPGAEGEPIVKRKLVRDGILDIIRRDGYHPIAYQADDDEYQNLLDEKLGEELEEFLEALDSASKVEELADLLEVVRARAVTLGVTWEGLLDVAEEKSRKRGRFADRVVWLGNETAASVKT